MNVSFCLDLLEMFSKCFQKSFQNFTKCLQKNFQNVTDHVKADHVIHTNTSELKCPYFRSVSFQQTITY